RPRAVRCFLERARDPPDGRREPPYGSPPGPNPRRARPGRRGPRDVHCRGNDPPPLHRGRSDPERARAEAAPGPGRAPGRADGARRTVISARLGGAGDIHLFAPVRGLASEVPLLLAALEGAPPSVVGLGISPEELKGLLDYFVTASAEPIVPLTTAERSEVRGLVRFGEVRVPNPAFVELLRWARAIPVEA